MMEHVSTGREVKELIDLFDYDIVLIDWDLPDMLAPEVIRMIRTRQHAVPVIVLGTPSMAAWPGRHRATVLALDAGADDFIDMPVPVEEMAARVRAVVRRDHGLAVSIIRLDDVELNINRHQVTVRGVRLNLSRKEFGILELLFLKKGTVLTKDALIQHLYGSIDGPQPKVIDVLVHRTRKKLAAAGAPDLIGTVWGCGYILGDATVTEPSGVRSAESQ